MNKLVVTFLFSINCLTTSAQMSGPDLLKKSILYHDPNGQWEELNAIISLEQTRPSGPTRVSEVTLKNNESYFKLIDETEGNVVMREVKDDSGKATVNGSSEFSQEVSDKYRLSQDRLLRTHNYYIYLYGLPMKLTDPGTNVRDEVKEVSFDGKDYLEIGVTYSEEVGTDDWFFYINPETFAMEGYKFLHQNGKGEYITLEGTSTVDNIKIPKLRKWYTTQDSTFLGADNITKIEEIE